MIVRLPKGIGRNLGFDLHFFKTLKGVHKILPPLLSAFLTPPAVT